MEDRSVIIAKSAQDSIDCLEDVAEKVESELSGFRTAGPYLASGNIFTSPKQATAPGQIREANKGDLERLRSEPILARVEYEDEDGNPGEIFIAPSAPPAGTGWKIASLNAAVGSIASRRPGSEFTLKIGGKDHDVLIKSVTKIYPRRKQGDWDSFDTVISMDDHGNVTIPSLREWLGRPVVDSEVVDGEEIDLLAKQLAEEDDEHRIIEGISRPKVEGFALRQERLVDEYQDEIYRLPINTQLFLSGPPGTGKTTTLIRRLGQKVDLSEGSLSESERSAIESAGPLSEHARSWMMFSPTELLKQYVTRNFNNEGVPATDENIKTWDEYRDQIAREYLDLLNTTSKRGLFVLREENSRYLVDKRDSSDDAVWYDSFISYFWNALTEELNSEVAALQRSPSPEVVELGRKISNILSMRRGGLDARIIEDMLQIRDELTRHLTLLKDEFSKIPTQLVRGILKDNENFLTEFGKQAADIRRQSSGDDSPEDGDEPFDDDEDDDRGRLTAQGRRAALAQFEKVLRTLANAKARGRKLGSTSFAARMVDWLTDANLPTGEQLKQLAQISTTQRAIRKFLRLDRLILHSIVAKFRAFRTDPTLAGEWYLEKPPAPSAICWRELDLLILATLRIGRDLNRSLDRVRDFEPSRGVLSSIKSLYKNQILVDEVTDFSLIQLAIMHELANPALNSFFVCGDFNQRLTDWGIRTDKDFDWISSQIRRRSVKISYRQTRKLVELAGAISLIDGHSEEVTLPDFNDIEGLAPVWGEELEIVSAKAFWLADRMREIETREGRLPSIAVLVNSEDQVEPLTHALNAALIEINYKAEACKDGKSLGSKETVRVFDIKHIKGLEFEAAFFVDMDALVDVKPDLYGKYLYVGSTRAATYFGLTFRQKIPPQLQTLKEHFQLGWGVS
ncbi:ATP-binding domain-containing protein [Agrobacterium tumefaciens]|uniref:ATP-binding domain-containing protein n=1 Tax=Agrobacterium tumefaciens TaxID=358 RepID=UPI002A0B1650|nr:ATP-binding domain-containing protein [Agrobacterium tumefaciens]MDX8326121.1 ATP-binding domain-containing protein [Agrobacterium tumefaciens]